LQALSQGSGSFIHGIKRGRTVFWIKQAFQSGTAGLHPASHLAFAQILLLRTILNAINNIPHSQKNSRYQWFNTGLNLYPQI
jgi:hypothetical protein